MIRIVESKYITSAVNAKGYPETNYPDFAFVGRSNVGKSSMINTLTGRKLLAKIATKPGKTRMINFFEIRCKWIVDSGQWTVDSGQWTVENTELGGVDCFDSKARSDLAMTEGGGAVNCQLSTSASLTCLATAMLKSVKPSVTSGRL
jgi:hypothetical protein